MSRSGFMNAHWTIRVKSQSESQQRVTRPPPRSSHRIELTKWKQDRRLHPPTVCSWTAWSGPKAGVVALAPAIQENQLTRVAGRAPSPAFDDEWWGLFVPPLFSQATPRSGKSFGCELDPQREAARLEMVSAAITDSDTGLIADQVPCVLHPAGLYVGPLVRDGA